MCQKLRNLLYRLIENLMLICKTSENNKFASSSREILLQTTVRGNPPLAICIKYMVVYTICMIVSNHIFIFATTMLCYPGKEIDCSSWIHPIWHLVLNLTIHLQVLIFLQFFQTLTWWKNSVSAASQCLAAWILNARCGSLPIWLVWTPNTVWKVLLQFISFGTASFLSSFFWNQTQGSSSTKKRTAYK